MERPSRNGGTDFSICVYLRLSVANHVDRRFETIALDRGCGGYARIAAKKDCLQGDASIAMLAGPIRVVP